MGKSELRRKYDALVAKSQKEYALAGIEARKQTDYAAFKAHTDKSWQYADEADVYFKQLPKEEQESIKSHALLSMSKGFVKGLGGASPKATAKIRSSKPRTRKSKPSTLKGVRGLSGLRSVW